MSRRSITDLPLPNCPYRVDLVERREGLANFEAVAASEAEDAIRARRLKAAQSGLKPAGKRQAARLARLLETSGRTSPPPQTLASARNMRRLRIRVIGAVWALVSSGRCERVATCTLLPRGALVRPGKLERRNAGKLMAALRSDLNRCGAAQADGILSASLHGEWDSGKARFRLHYHVVATDGMIEVVNRLRDRPKYSSERKGRHRPGAVFQRVRISRKPLSDLPHPLTYFLQSYWPSKWSGTNAEGKPIRQRRKHRIPEPQHSEYLLWLDRWQLKDITLLMNLQVTKAGLTMRGGGSCTRIGRKGAEMRE